MEILIFCSAGMDFGKPKGDPGPFLLENCLAATSSILNCTMEMRTTSPSWERDPTLCAAGTHSRSYPALSPTSVKSLCSQSTELIQSFLLPVADENCYLSFPPSQNLHVRQLHYTTICVASRLVSHLLHAYRLTDLSQHSRAPTAELWIILASTARQWTSPGKK